MTPAQRSVQVLLDVVLVVLLWTLFLTVAAQFGRLPGGVELLVLLALGTTFVVVRARRRRRRTTS